jgi:hypothetical protein
VPAGDGERIQILGEFNVEFEAFVEKWLGAPMSTVCEELTATAREVVDANPSPASPPPTSMPRSSQSPSSSPTPVTTAMFEEYMAEHDAFRLGEITEEQAEEEQVDNLVVDMRTELQPLKLVALMQRAQEAGVSQDALGKAEDSDGIINLILLHKAREEEEVAANLVALRAELEPLKLFALMQRATQAGVSQDVLEEASDRDAQISAAIRRIPGGRMSPRRSVQARPEFDTEEEGFAAVARKVVVPDGTGGRIYWDKDKYRTLHGPHGAVRGLIKSKAKRCVHTANPVATVETTAFL